MTMEVSHPNAQDLSEEQKLLVSSYKQRIESMVSNGGVTSENVQSLVSDLRAHPMISKEIMHEIRQELNQLMPGQRFMFD